MSSIAVAVSEDRITAFRDLSGLTTALKTTLGAYLGLAAIDIGLWSGRLAQRATNGGVFSQTEGDVEALVGGLKMIITVVTVMIFLRWTYLANRNVRSLGADALEFTPGWTVGWYFVPIAFLWKPYQALKETFKASHPDFTENWKQAPRPAIVPLWWTLWILTSFVGLTLIRTMFRAETVDEVLALTPVTYFTSALELPLMIVVILLVSKLQAWQSEKHRRVASATT